MTAAALPSSLAAQTPKRGGTPTTYGSTQLSALVALTLDE